MGTRSRGTRSLWLVVCSVLSLSGASGVARGDTVQSFDTAAGGTAFATTDPRTAPPPEAGDFGDCSAIGAVRLTEDDRTFLRLSHFAAPIEPHINCNAVTFNCVEAPTVGQVAIDFDFRVTKPGGPLDAADGFSISLLRAGADLARGGPPIGIDEFAGPELLEEPAIAGSLGFGFRVFRHPPDEPVETVKIFWDGALVHRAEIPIERTMVNAGWFRASIRVDFGRREVSAVVTHEDTTEFLRIPPLVIPGLAPSATRVHLAATGRGLTANFDVDQLRVVFPPRDRAMVGSWSPAFPLASIPIHAALLPGGKVLYWDRHDAGDGRPYLLDGVTSTLPHDMPMRPDGEDYDTFCAGHTFAADGSLFVAGGHIRDDYGEPWASRFDPAMERWSALPPMRAGRWYPTTTTLPSGDIIAVAGAINPFTGTNEIPEVFDARTGRWRALTGAERPLPNYPFMFTTPRGLFAAGPMVDTAVLDVGEPGRWIPIDKTLAGRTVPSAIGRDYGTAVLTDAAAGRILTIGGTTLEANNDRTLRSTEWIDLSEPSPRWRSGPAMTFARRMHVGTLLPDGSVLVTGGTTSNAFNRADGAVLNAELLTSLEDRWQPMACAAEARVYHSVALLLPDARVLVAGGGHPGEIDHPTAEIFSPPYLHRGVAQLPAPLIAAGPGVVLGEGGIARVRYGARIAYATPDPARVAAVRWLRPAAVTHAFNQDQRSVRLTAGPAGIGAQAVAPHDRSIAPPGPYMMFLIDAQGVPSHAAWVRTNLPPDAVDDVIEIVEDQAIPHILERVVANDVDAERDPTTLSIVEPPHAGEIVDGTYVPGADFSGEDSFRYTLSDGLDSSRVATVAIRIAPIADPPPAPPVVIGDDHDGSAHPPRGGGCRIGSDRAPLGWLIAALVTLAAIRRRR